jgi:hypothetical protein
VLRDAAARPFRCPLPAFGVLGAVVLAFALTPVSALAGVVGAGFTCQPAPITPGNIEAPPSPPPSVIAHTTATPATDHLTVPCPSGEVPYPTPTDGVDTNVTVTKALPPVDSQATPTTTAGTARYAAPGRGVSPRVKRRGAHAQLSRVYEHGDYYSWAGAFQDPPGGDVSQVWDYQTNQDPNVFFHNQPGSHSLSQLWAINSEDGNDSTVEEGWTEAPLTPYNDVSPHLFVARADCGVYSDGGYVGISGSTIPWVQTSSTVYPNMVVTHDDYTHSYAVWRDSSNNWHFYYDGEWFGYIPSYAWSCRFPTNVNDVQFGGEVATPEYETCTDMGNGTSGPNAADHEYTYWVNNSNGEPGNFIDNHVIQSDPEYIQGEWQGGDGFVWGFRYGGTGWC